MKKLFLLLTCLVVQACALISQGIGLYKLSAGSVSIDSDDSKWQRLTYHGKKAETKESAISRWELEASDLCRGGIVGRKTDSFVDQMMTPGDTEKVNTLMINYPEKSKEWPQVSGMVKCAR